MKIGILTQPLHNNYGGMLQAYALKETLQYLGHETVIINRRGKETSWMQKKASILKSRILNRNINQFLFLNSYQKKIISLETLSFQKKYIPNLSSLITDNKGMLALNNMDFNAYVVGSDQCWRPIYSPNIKNYFLDFAKEQINVKRISYAASFGVNEWEFNKEDEVICKKLIQKFDGISVREDSGIELIKKHFGRDDAIHLIDPTMLLSIEKYKNIGVNENIPASVGNLNVYILDKSEEKDRVINHIINKFGYTPFEVHPKKRFDSEKVTDKNIEDFVYPNPAKWIRGFQDAKFVVTDSFHGTVFSILFNVPFITIGNKKRGIARFESLLNMFELKDRFITDFSKEKINYIISNDIDWDKVNIILNKEQKKAINFLKKNLQ